MGIMEKENDTTISGLGLRLLGFFPNIGNQMDDDMETGIICWFPEVRGAPV